MRLGSAAIGASVQTEFGTRNYFFEAGLFNFDFLQQHPLDTQYFDKTFTVEKAKLTPIDQTILQSMDQTQFQGFSYTNPNATDK